MTPTNDAPVTVEQCDADRALDYLTAIEGQRLSCAKDTLLASEFARHRLAALASAPAEPRLNPTPIEALADTFTGKTEVDRLAIILMRAFGKAEPEEGISQHPASYVATFADMARAVIASAPAGWIVGNGDGTKWRTWGVFGSEWTDDRDKATRYARREDAETVHSGDEDAWTIQPYAASAPAGDGVEEAIERMRANPFMDDAAMLGTSQQEARIAHYARAALARPRAAVGEPAEYADQIVIAWESSPHQFPVTGPHQLQMALIAARAILALQSPPAKVEGE